MANEKTERNLQIVELRKQGKSMREVALMLNLSIDTVKPICRRYGVGGVMSTNTRGTGGKHKPNRDLEIRNTEIVELAKSGELVNVIAEKYGLGIPTINTICRKANVKAKRELTQYELEDIKLDNQIIDLIRNGKTTKEILEIINYKQPDRIYKVAKENNLKIATTLTDMQKACIEMRAKGMLYHEIANAIGVKTKNISQCCNNLGIGETDEEKGITNAVGHKKQRKTITKKEKEVSQFISERIPDFEYVGGYTGCDDDVTIRCKKCGTVTTRNMGTIRHSNVRCEVCAEHEREERKRLKAELKEKQRIERARLRKLREQIKKQEYEAKRREVVCPVCGKSFITYIDNQKYCSEECRKINDNRMHSRDKRFAKRGLKKNPKINARALYERDNGICWICGKPCDINDYEVREDGTIVCGENYPSVDHVKPVYQGGTDTWDNVRLAHRGCNSKRYIDEK